VQKTTMANQKIEYNDIVLDANIEEEEEEEGTMKALHEGEIYKYLGIEQCRRTEAKLVRERISNEFTKRINFVCKAELNGSALIKAINTYAVPDLTYLFGVIKWSYTDLEALQMKMRTTLTKHCYHYLKAAIEQTVMPQSEVGQGMIDIINLHDQQLMKMREYFYAKRSTSTLVEAIVQAEDGLTFLNL